MRWRAITTFQGYYKKEQTESRPSDSCPQIALLDHVVLTSILTLRAIQCAVLGYGPAIVDDGQRRTLPLSAHTAALLKFLLDAGDVDASRKLLCDVASTL